MDRKRSYLDSLNAGRQRRPQTSLDQLSRSLEQLEKQLDVRSQGAAVRPPRMNEPMERAPQRDDRRPRENAGPANLAGELEALRAQMATLVGESREARRSNAPRQSASFPEADAIKSEIERLTDAVQSLSKRSDDRPLNALRLELEQARKAIDELAREDSVRAISDRWEEFEHRMLTQPAPIQQAPAYDELLARLEQTQAAVESMARNNPANKISERWDDFERRMMAAPQAAAGQDRTLQTLLTRLEETQARIDAMARNNPVNAINERWDDFERRMMAVPQAASVDQTRALEVLLDRIEETQSRIDSLAREDSMRQMTQRWDEFEQRMSSQAQMPGAKGGDQEIKALMARIDQMGMMLRDLPSAMPLQSLDDRLHRLTGAIEELYGHSQAPHSDSGALSSIQARLDDISEAISAGASASGTPFGNDALDRMESRIADLSRKIEDRFDRPVSLPSFDEDAVISAIDARFGDLEQRFGNDRSSQAMVRGIEDRLDDLASRIDGRGAAASSMDPLLVSNLEAQIANLADFLDRTNLNAGQPDISPRLERLERSLGDNRDMMITVASEAAENAVRQLALQPGADGQAAAALANDLRDLEALTRRSDERNSKTFEAVHDTLLKIVDRLGSIEQKDVEPEPIARQQFSGPKTPSIEPPAEAGFDQVDDRAEDEYADNEFDLAPLAPASAAAAAAAAALGETAGAGVSAPPPRRSMLGGLASRLSRKPQEKAPAAIEPHMGATAPSVELDQPLDPKLTNRPLEPGSGAPDLNAIMKRVRDERTTGPAKQNATDAARADFLAAARRNAQAAAAEAQILKTKAKNADAGSESKLGALFKSRRKLILMAVAAALTGLVAMQLGKSLMSDNAAVADSSSSSAPMIASTSEPAKIGETAPAADAEPVRVAEPKAAATEVVAEPDDAMALSDDGPDQPIDAASGDAPAAGEQEIVATAPVEAPANVTVADVPADAGPIALREAASAGDRKALFEIGARYADGRGVKADKAAAAKWYEKAADLGFAPAQYRIGNFYEKGTGVERNVAKAKEWYQLAASQGNASAMHNLAVLFAMGADGTPDNDSAVRWFTQAADYGVKDSQFNLGILAAKGVGMPTNLEDSYKWFALVAKGGDRDAAAKRDEIAKALRPEQLQRARAAVELWKAKEPSAEANVVEVPESWQESAGHTAGVDMKKAIRNVQAILNKNGYNAGVADGVMGERTKVAIRQFQKDNALAETGEVDKALVEKLLAKN